MNELAAVETSSRWQPTRAGLVALWRYWDETFVFHRGRLLLRGPNGSGKSMALELLLPFLLDGDTNPARLTSAAKSRGRLFDRVMTGTGESSRTGFAWVEFRRGEAVFTVGARMRASQQTNKVDVDLFTTTLTVGRDLHLLDETRTPLSKKALEEAIGGTGRVHRSPDEHRAAVRDVLFPGFSDDRYRSVIGALLALRKEKLSQNLDLEKLSDVLSEALPPIDEHDLAAVAEGFERLDRRKAELESLRRELDEVRALARRQRDYARAVVVGLADEVRKAETRRDDVTRAERTAGEALAEAEESSRAATREHEELAAAVRKLTTEIEALKDSHAYREGATLNDLRVAADAARRRAADAAAHADATARKVAGAEEELADAQGELDVARSNLALAQRDLMAAAEQVGAESAVEDAATAADAEDAETLVRAWVRARQATVAEVRAAVDEHARSVQRRTSVEEQVGEAETTVDARAAALRAAQEDHEEALDAYRGELGRWVERCALLDRERLRRVLPAVSHDPAAVGRVVQEMGTELREREATARENVRARRVDVEAEIAALQQERARWDHADTADPPAPAWRDHRGGIGGAPLWRLVDLSPEADAVAVDGVESALVAMGLADAWVQPDGGVDLADGRADLVLTRRERGTRTLASLLAPAADAAERGVPPEIVAGVLASVAVAESVRDAVGGDEVVAGLDGTFRIGSAVGRAVPQPATLFGTAARERHRLAQLERIDDALAGCAAALAELTREVEALDRARAALDAELAAAPPGDEVAATLDRVTAASARLEESRERLGAVEDKLRAAEQAVRSALRQLTASAARHGLPADLEQLRAVEAALLRLLDAVGVWGRRRREEATSARQVHRAERTVAEARSDAVEAARRGEAAAREAEATEQRVGTLEAAIGADYADVLHRIAAHEQARRDADVRAGDLEEQTRELAGRIGRLTEKLAAATRERELADEHRSSTHRRFVASVEAFRLDAELAVDAGMLSSLSGASPATDVLGAARSVFAAHEKQAGDPQAVERLSERVNERLHEARTLLGSRIDLERDLAEGGWWVLRTTVNGMRRSINELAAMLDRELDDGRRELAADEEALFEQTLAGTVRRSLADRIRDANALVDAINGQLGAVRTAAGGVEVRLRWDVDHAQPAAVRAARALLLRDPADLSESERRSLQEFVRARVDQARAELEANAPWDARLRETLDYRAWHRFTLLLAHRDWDGFQPATPRRLQRLSTGERSIALHLPMIASVAAHYAGESGRPSGCPRLILLDELFAGVDATNRAQLFGTFTTWDLDAVFTSDHEWCQYASLDGIAIHHLHPPTGDEPVTSTRFTWDGQQRTIDTAA